MPRIPGLAVREEHYCVDDCVDDRPRSFNVDTISAYADSFETCCDRNLWRGTVLLEMVAFPQRIHNSVSASFWRPRSTSVRRTFERIFDGSLNMPTTKRDANDIRIR